MVKRGSEEIKKMKKGEDRDERREKVKEGGKEREKGGK